MGVSALKRGEGITWVYILHIHIRRRNQNHRIKQNRIRHEDYTSAPYLPAFPRPYHEETTFEPSKNIIGIKATESTNLFAKIGIELW